jgi:parallel beta-helix repeat protein
MQRSSRVVPYIAALGLIAGFVAVGTAPAGAAPLPGNHFNDTLVVSNNARGPSSAFTGGAEVSCRNARFSTISSAVAAASPGATIAVCPGTYVEDVTVNKPLTIVGSGATVAPDSSDTNPLFPVLMANNGFTVVSPWVTIKGFIVEGATGDGLLVAGDHALIEGNTVMNNGLANPNNPGNGINVDGSSYSTIRGNTVSGSGNGGIQLANDPDAIGLPTICAFLDYSCNGITGTATYDTVIGNNVNNNPFACGILLVDHDPFVGSGPDLVDGVHDNFIGGNSVLDNALQGYGAGILLASEVPGGAVYNNVISGNDVAGNGLSGLTLHEHVAGEDLNGNAIIGNDFGTNNTKDEEPSDTQTTGVFIGSEDHLNITVLGNFIHDDYYGVYTASSNGVTVKGLALNLYVHDNVPWYQSNVYSG